MRGQFEWKDTELQIRKDQISLNQCLVIHWNRKAMDYVCV